MIGLTRIYKKFFFLRAKLIEKNKQSNTYNISINNKNLAKIWKSFTPKLKKKKYLKNSEC